MLFLQSTKEIFTYSKRNLESCLSLPTSVSLQSLYLLRQFNYSWYGPSLSLILLSRTHPPYRMCCMLFASTAPWSIAPIWKQCLRTVTWMRWTWWLNLTTRQWSGSVSTLWATTSMWCPFWRITPSTFSAVRESPSDWNGKQIREPCLTFVPSW